MEKSSFLFVMISVMIIIVMLIVMMIITIIPPIRIGPGRHFRCWTFDYLVQLAPVQPYTAAFRTIINFYTLTFLLWLMEYYKWDNSWFFLLWI